MDAHIECDYEFSLELREAPGTESMPVHREILTNDLEDLVDEAFTTGVLAERLAFDPARLHIVIRPTWQEEPVVRQVEIEMTSDDLPDDCCCRQTFIAGRWTRRSLQRALQMREEGALAEDRSLYSTVLATRPGHCRPYASSLESPVLEEQSLEDFGVRSLGAGCLEPDRPVLVNHRMVEEIIELTLAAGVRETGSALLGKIIKLPEPLPGTRTRIVTVLSTSVVDQRHVGTSSEVSFSPEALAEADRLSQMRGLGEHVVTVMHSHGWGTGCDNCNQNADCAIPQCTFVSLQDYQLVESLLPSKATVLPIVGRKLGAEGRRPVLEIYAWRGGQMRPIRWQRYHD